jgi:predicted SAM-dependent methyltransferase
MTRRYPQVKDKKVMLNLGCGGQRLNRYIGIDIRDLGQKMVWDVRDGLPFPDNSVDEVFSCHFIEHLTDKESLELFHEIYRVLKVGATTHHRCPHQTHPTAYFWGHRSFWNEARIKAIERVPELDKFLIVENNQKDFELFFTLKKLK